MSWPEDMRALADDALGDLEPDEVLYDYELPCIFTARTPGGESLLVYLVEELEEGDRLRFLAVPTTAHVVAELKAGTISVRDALTLGWMWVVDTDAALRPNAVFATDVSQLPKDALPAPATMLWPSLEPELRVRLVGEQLRRGAIPALLFAQASEIAARALKGLFELAAKSLLPESSGRPPEWLRTLYNLPTQRVGYGSLDLSFRKPAVPSAEQLALQGLGDEGEKRLEKVVDEGWDLLMRGLRWVTAGGDEELEAATDEERVAILLALKQLAPNASGPIGVVEVSGARVGGPSTVWTLDRRTSQRVRSSLSELTRRERMSLRVFTGRVRDLDLDKMSLILRDLVDSEVPELSFVIEEEPLLEVARDAHYQEILVTVAAKSHDGKKWVAVEIAFVDSNGLAAEDVSDG